MLEISPIFHALLRSKAGAILLILQISITVAIVSNSLAIINDRIDYIQRDSGYPEQDLFYITTSVFAKNTDLLYLIAETETTLRNLDGVVNANFMQEIPLSGSGSSSSFGILPSDQVGEEGYRNARASYTGADHQIFETLGVSLSEGRLFRPEEVIKAETRGTPPSVVVVTKDFVNELFPEQDGLGNFIYIGNSAVEIVGILDRAMGPWPSDSRPLSYAIFPYIEAVTYQKYIIRTEPGQRSAVMKIVEDALLEQFNQRVIIEVTGLDKAKRDYQAGDYLMLRMLIVLIVLLVAITALGIFGLTVFNISKRTKQIGTRRALGARKSAIIRYFLIETSMLCVAGLILGSLAAVYLGQVLFEHYSVPAFELTFIAYTAIFVLCMCLVSVVFPANRAANISPSIATRSV